MPFHLFPENAARGAGEVDWIFWALTVLSVFILVLVFVPIIYFAVKYRKGSNADRTLSKMSTLKFEITWTVIPLIVGLGIFAWAAEVYFRIETPPADALQVSVVGKQWMWKLQHAEGNREINELHIPVGRAVVLTMTSQDVIHDFFVPAFVQNRMWFRAATPPNGSSPRKSGATAFFVRNTAAQATPR